MKNYFKILAAVVLVGSIFFACSKEETTNSLGEQAAKQSASNKGTCCYINGTTLTEETLANLCAPGATAAVLANSSATYSYVNQTGTPNSVAWTLTGAGASFSPSNNVTTMTTMAPTSSVIVYFSSIFQGGTLTAAATVGELSCDTVLNILKAQPDCSCSPLFSRILYNVPNPYTGGNIENAIQFENRATCTFDWSTVSSIKVQIGGTFGVGSNAVSVPNINFFGTPGTGNWANNTNWTSVSSGFRNIKIWTHTNTSNVAPPYLRNNTLYNQPGWATISFNNGCDDKLLYINDDEDFSFIN